jgi:ABC-type antimicrobial peptide transport system permease subunit
MTPFRAFFKGMLIGLSIFILANVIAAHLLSDCGLPAVLGADSCADDIARAGFPLVFLETGGFAFRSIFNQTYFLLDIFTGLALGILCGFIARWKVK